MLDCYGCPKEKLSDMDLVFNTLDKLPEEIGMQKIMPPYVFKYKGLVPEDWGVSGVVLIAESHISIHTFPDKEHVFVDVFSCKDFDTAMATEFMVKTFGPRDYEVQLLHRGVEFPRNVRKAGQVVTKERRSITERPQLYVN